MRACSLFLYAGGMPLSKTEATARALLAHYFPRERFIYNIRPSWLINPKTGRRLELDIYCPDRKLAIEIDGIQHGRYIPGMHRDFEGFTDQQARDMHKIEACKAQGITLYKLTIFDMNLHRFPPFADRISKTHGLTLNRYAGYPHHLFKQADKLSRAKFKVRPYRKPGLWPLLQRMFYLD